ncbi:hypothetical protein [Dyadobacter frigoris]|uniref:Uncharacterized protein n=1 Tax=Dyadobacter frigoris TaxID=2576211 RepID=A0A4U6CXE0_9BACT|nr:hypothetical protein [Dyadobacter frigoris]TKT89469.1 hypothetical protein FDK13_24310 [Dyadobacter frigoris]
MSNKRQQLLDLFLNPKSAIQVYRAVVKSIDDHNRCTVTLFGSDLEVDNVTLVAEEDGSEWIKLRPRVGSVVLVGAVNNEVSDMYLVQYGELDGGEILCGNTLINFDKDQVNLVNGSSSVALSASEISISQDQTEISLSNNLVSITNGSVTLKELFDDLTSLLQNFKVVTAQGPSTALFPDTLASLTALKSKYPLLLS